MLSWSPPLFSPFGWPLEDSVSITHEENNFFTREAEANSSTPSFLNSPPLLSHEPLIAVNSGEGECKNSNDDVDRECDDNIATTTPTITAKKLNHNASERDRRKRINDLYSSLRSLLPAADQTVEESILISEILLNLEEDGLILLNASCFESFGDKIFYNIHLEVQGGQRVEFETLRERLLSFV
ncbi:hypothetical protein C3L33_12209, partial [Rhododendron williamsianum]